MKHLVFAALILLLASCAQENQSRSANGAIDGEEIISNRPINQEPFLAIIRLENPSLLENPTYDSRGGVVIDEGLAGKILLEQERVIADMKRVSQDVEVIFRYRLSLNALAVVVPANTADQLSRIEGVTEIREANEFYRPKFDPANVNAGVDLGLIERNSVKFIGATDANQFLKARDNEGQLVPLRGQGVRVGVIDTGIDYTHAMFGGTGTEDAFKAVDPNAVDAQFPTEKVAGGYDFAGSEFDVGSHIAARRIPRPDRNPIDEQGHGTHVAGTVAGVGDYRKSHDGVAPDALLYSLKVFGKEGSTSDAVVIAALEYALDPDGDLNPSDRLDVVNLSLGGGFGKPYILYSEAIKNVTNGGTVVVAAAGNSGPTNFIVGAPSTAPDALSVAASIDNSFNNWRFDATHISGADGTLLKVKAIEGPISKSVKQATESGALYYIGIAAEDLTEEQKTALNGKIALIDRGVVPFVDKLRRAKEGGAIGAIVANNVAGDPIVMGGEGKVEIPAIMVTQAIGTKIKELMKLGDVVADFGVEEKIEEPQVIDTLTSFSSKGPRSLDYLIKPEITAPGQGIVSARMGGGDVAVRNNGTSMAAPHIAGVAALMRQLHPKLDARQVKAMLINGATPISDAADTMYPISRQGAGRVQVLKSATLPAIVDTATISLGQIEITDRQLRTMSLKVTNISSGPIEVSLKSPASAFQVIQGVTTQSVSPGSSTEIPVSIDIQAPLSQEAQVEMDGFLRLDIRGDHLTEKTSISVPMMAS